VPEILNLEMLFLGFEGIRRKVSQIHCVGLKTSGR
jgi:hypothetical protein